MQKKRSWTAQELRVLEYLYPDTNTVCIASLLKRNVGMIHRKATIMKLRKTKAYVAKQGSISSNHPKSVSKRFGAGIVPWNKGTKGAHVGGIKTQFKKGYLPHNTREDGAKTKRSDGYWWVRVGLGRWDLLHREVWRKDRGEIPDGHVVVFRDKNPDNYSIDNLEMITFEENMVRNSIHNYPEDIKDTVRTIAVLTREINKQSKRNGKHSIIKKRAFRDH